MPITNVMAKPLLTALMAIVVFCSALFGLAMSAHGQVTLGAEANAMCADCTTTGETGKPPCESVQCFQVVPDAGVVMGACKAPNVCEAKTFTGVDGQTEQVSGLDQLMQMVSQLLQQLMQGGGGGGEGEGGSPSDVQQQFDDLGISETDQTSPSDMFDFSDLSDVDIEDIDLEDFLEFTLTDEQEDTVNEEGDTTVTCITLAQDLEVGAEGDDVETLQTFLAQDPAIYPEGTISGFFGSLTRAAVERFQCQNNIVCDGTPATTGYGRVGPSTRAVMACEQIIEEDVEEDVVEEDSMASCILEDVEILHGESQTFYSEQTVPFGQTCETVEQTRTCTDGTLSGDNAYQYKECSVEADHSIPTPPPAAQCLDLTQNLSLGMSGADVTELQEFLAQDSSVYPEGLITGFYGGLTQQAVERFQCQNNIVCDGTPATTGYGRVGPATRQAMACDNETEGAACTLDGTTVAHSQSQTFYSAEVVAFGDSCESQNRVCISGTLSGDDAFQYTECAVAEATSCVVGDISIDHGETRSFYSETSVPFGETCTTQSRTCTNGSLSGDTAYQYDECVVANPSACVVNGVSVAHGESRTLYSEPLVPYGSSCSTVSQSRTCTDNMLSGDAEFEHASCSVAPAQVCVLDGITVSPGTAHTFYALETVPAGNTCSAVAQSRICENGTLTGNQGFRFAQCAVEEAAVENGGMCLDLTRTLSNGMSGADVTRLQELLASDPSLYPEGLVTGYFGALTEAAVRRYQCQNNIVCDGTPATTGFGVAGPLTRAALSCE